MTTPGATKIRQHANRLHSRTYHHGKDF
ncbi:hypothetical protein EUZ85_22655 [Hahella sp. KA22]|nr:hypothetical protein ENC22_20075 [Hahella sp. KA22]QAY58460.1 hypothetical protein EUZ85_22655 [Hahella sp. KA22]